MKNKQPTKQTKLTNQNLHKSEIEFQTKFGDDAQLNARLDELEPTAEQCDAYVQQERKFIKRLIEMSTFEPRRIYASSASAAELKAKSSFNADLSKCMWKSFLDKRLVYRCSESDLRELKYFVDNFDSIVKFGNQDAESKVPCFVVLLF